MTNKLTITALAILGLAGAANADVRGQWKAYPSFDNDAICIIPTPSKTYFLGHGQKYDTRYSDYSDYDAFLFAYDPEGDEVTAYTSANYLSASAIRSVQYNARKRYLVIAYTDGNIDLLYDDNSVKNIDALRNATISSSKDINSITFDNEKGHIYMGGNFGFIVLDESTGKVVNSRIYNRPVYSVAHIGNKLFIALDDGIYMADDTSPVFSVDDFTLVKDFGFIDSFMPVDGGRMAFVAGSGLYLLTPAGNSADIKNIGSVSSYKSVTGTRDGYYVCNSRNGIIVGMDGSVTSLPNTPESAASTTITGTWDGREIWQIIARKGLASFNLTDGKYTATRTGIYPNVPNAYRCHNGMAYSPKYGMLVNNHEVNNVFPTYNVRIPALTSALRDGMWTSYGYPYTNPDYANSLYDPNGLTIDPDNPDYIYYGSFLSGIQRKNLADPTDVLHLTHPSDPASKLPGYVKLDDDDPGWADFFSMAPPRFDAEGNMWMQRYNFTQSAGLTIYVWPAAARRSGDTSKIVKWQQPVSGMSHPHLIVPLTHSSNRNLVLISNGNFSPQIVIRDTKGTPTVPDDDTYVTMSTIYDQDGNRMTGNYIYDIWEDPQTGLVWVVGASQLFTFRPTDAMKDPSHVTRIKVARDDGTNLADYLLDNVTIFKMTADGNGRKWFATSGGGLVVTSSDGRTIEDEINTSNSDIPDDMVYSVAYNPGENSIVASTRRGIAEYRLSGSAAAGEPESTVKIYPNPVRPDYLGWVTIENLPDNAVVKICDSLGNLVKELGISTNGMVQWDGTNTEMKRVKSGVYHVFTSSSDEGDSANPKGKILVIN